MNKSKQQFRIIKRFWRGDLGAIFHAYRVQQWHEGWFLGGWRDCKYYYTAITSRIRIPAEFETEREAREFIKHKSKSLPKDIIINL